MTKNEPHYNIICLSNQLWDFPLWTNKKHVMTRLGKLGHKVLFVDPPINFGKVFFKHFIAGEWPPKRLLTKQKNDDNIRIYSPINYDFVNFDSSKKFSKNIQKISAKFFDPTYKTILWIYHMESGGLQNYINTIKHDVLVYDCVDNYIAFPTYNTPAKREKIKKQEEFLTQKADIVFATAPGLVDRLQRLNAKTFFTPNVGDYERFIRSKDLKNSLPDDLSSIPRPRVGFVGAVDEYKFDRQLFKQMAKDFPGYSFVIIGSMALKDSDANLKEMGLDNLKNVYYLGVKPFFDLPNYYAGFDVFLIPYVLNDYTVGGCFPIKFHEGLAAGLPVVVTDLPAYKPFSDVCYISKSYNEFSQNIRRAIEEDTEDKIKDRQKVAKENNWEGKVAKMLTLIKTEALQE